MNEPREVMFTTQELAYMQESTQRKIAALRQEVERVEKINRSLNRILHDTKSDLLLKLSEAEAERDRALNLFAELRRDYADYDCDDPECGGRCIWCRYRALAEPTTEGGTP